MRYLNTFWLVAGAALACSGSGQSSVTEPSAPAAAAPPPVAMSIAIATDDAATRLTGSFGDGEAPKILRKSLGEAAAAVRAGDKKAAQTAIAQANSALQLVDPNGRDPDAAAIRLVVQSLAVTFTSPDSH